MADARDSLRVLSVEDSQLDAELIEVALSDGGFVVELCRVADHTALSAALADPGWDVVLCDYELPGFDARAAYRLCVDAGLDVPFVVVSGAIGEDAVAAALRAGADDYVSKERLQRLPDVLRANVAALEARRREQRLAERLRTSEMRLAEAQAIAGLGSWEWDVAADRVSWSAELYRIFGVAPDACVASYAGYVDLVHPEDRDVVDLNVSTALSTREPFAFQHRVTRSDGATRWIQSNGRPVGQLADGRPALLVGTALDITGLVESERAARESEEELREAQRLARLGSWSWDPRDDSGVWSEEMFHIFGRDPQQGAPSRDAFLGYIRPADRPNVAEAYRAMLAGEQALEREYGIVRDDGVLRIVHALASADPRRPGRYVGTIQDITERKQIEEDLRDRERQLAEAQALARFGSWELDVDTQRLRWSDELCRIAGRPLGFSPTLAEFLALIHPDDLPALTDRVDAAWTGEFTHSEYRIVRPDGEIRHIHTRRFGRVDDDGAVIQLWGTTQDITDRVAAERDVRSAREHAEAIIAAMGEGYALTIDGILVSVNDALCELTGFTRDELVGAGMPFPFWPVDRLRESREIRDGVVAAGGQTFEIELMRADGSRFAAEITAHPATLEDGSHIGFVNTIRDVSVRKHYEIDLERERRDLNEAQVVARIGSWDYDVTNTAPARWSEQLWRMLDMAPGGLPPSLDELLALITEPDRVRVRQALTQAATAEPIWDGEFAMHTATGRELVVSLHAAYVLDAEGRVLSAHGTLQDVTERAQRDSEERALRRIAELVAENAGSTAVFAAVAAEVQQLFRAHSGLVIRFDDTQDSGTVISGHRADGGPIEPVTFDRDGDTVSAIVARTGQPARVDSPPPVTSDPATEWLASNQIHTAAAAPVIVDGRLWGTLAAEFTRLDIPADTAQQLAGFARLISMAIANADSWDVLSRQAATDPVTGLPNHRTFQSRLRAEVNRAARYDHRLSLVLFDLDHFKAVNDTYGHQAGDRVLAEVGRRLSSAVRDGELVARIGGEEFAWLMPESGSDAACQAADRLRRAIEADPFPHAGTITVSGGICTRDDHQDAEELVRQADRALYWAKGRGRNTTCLYSSEVHAAPSTYPAEAENPGAMSSVRGLARAIDSKDPATSEHSERVADMAERIARHLGWTAKRARLLYACGLLHDVGKIGIPDEILLKPGKLTAEEYERVKLHPEVSARIAAEVLESEQVAWIRGHHERWDGTGYPDRLGAEQIPDGAQILAVADAYDAMTESRLYQPRKSRFEALTECEMNTGTQFAPVVVDALVTIERPDRVTVSGYNTLDEGSRAAK